MTQSLPSSDALLITIVLATLAIGLPILMVLSIRFLWDRKLNLGRSKELEKLIWQLHRIASAMEQQMKLPIPAAQPAMEKPRDLADTQQPATQPAAETLSVPASVSASPSEAHLVPVEQPKTTPPSAKPSSASPATPRKPSAEGEHSAGVNSMFGF